VSERSERTEATGEGGSDRPGWRWRAEPRGPGAAVVFDLDGVLSDAGERQRYLRGGGRQDWKAFFDAAGDDALIEEVAQLTELLHPGLCLVLLTARPLRIQDRTLDWLARHELRWDLLVMRAEGDHLPSPIFKRGAVTDLRAAGFELCLAFEDDRRNVDMFHAEGVPCIYIHSGYYD
jgi:phosphoglycolate phosphatase-like HAD superfamily hydrolase